MQGRRGISVRARLEVRMSRELLMVRDVDEDLVAGSWDILAPEAALRAGRYHAEDAFDLDLLAVLRDRMVEMGPARVHPAYRAADVVPLLVSGLARYLIDNGHDYVLGAAGLDLADGGHAAASIYRAACENSMSPEDYRVFPRCRLPLENLCETRAIAAPPLLKAYLELGAWISGEPAWDTESNCALVPILMPLARMQDRYARHFLARAA